MYVIEDGRIIASCGCRLINGEPCFGCVPLEILTNPIVRHCMKREDGCMVYDGHRSHADLPVTQCLVCELRYLGSGECPICSRPRLVKRMDRP